MANNSNRSLQLKRRRTAIVRNYALRQVKKQRKASATINSSNSILVKTGAVSKKDAKKESLKHRSISMLGACGIDVSLLALDRDFKSARFSLLKEETGTEILRNLDNSTAREEQYKLLKKRRKTLDVKKIALNDAIRQLDDRLGDSRVTMERMINSDRRHDFNLLARNIAVINRAPGESFLKYFRQYENDYDPRDTPMMLVDTISIVKDLEVNYDGISTLTPSELYRGGN